MKLFHVLSYSIVVLITAVTSEKSEKNNNLIVELSYGKLKGKDNGYYLSYESIPYAEPPVGDLRFEAPQAYQRKWTYIYDATKAPNICMQWDFSIAEDYKVSGVEDCLFVNVFKPKTGKQSYPVMVYIHGGGFMLGSGNYFGKDFLMKNGNIILVTLSYRLGPLGFLSTEDEAITGNFGLKDQKLALEWIKENIVHFGGDPKKIMLSGFSAGAVSTHLLMLQPTLKHIAKVAVSLSGVSLNPWSLIKNPHRDAVKVADLLHCPDIKNTHEIKQCLKTKTAEDIVATVREFLIYGNFPFTVFGPVIEHRNVKNAFLQQHPIDIIKSGNITHIPWLASYTAQEGGFFSSALLQINPKTGEQFLEDLNNKWLEYAPLVLFLKNIRNDPQEYAKQLKSMYVGTEPFSEKNYLKLQKMFTDVLFINGIHKTIKLHSRYANSPVYSYVYDNPADSGLNPWVNQRRDIDFGTIHTYDLNLILSYSGRSYRTDERIISKKLINMLVDFAETGKLTYGECNFENNADKSDKLKVLHITRDDCKTIVVK